VQAVRGVVGDPAVLMTEVRTCPITDPTGAGVDRAARRRETIPEGVMIRLLIAIVLPWLSFFFIGKPIQGIVCIILQITLIGWIPAAIWAVYALSQYDTDRKIAEARNRP
jgi:uncharacterized membrane protein YqaE (UPF0057 family)